MQDQDPPLHRPPLHRPPAGRPTANRQSWLVTGASAGIGLAICRALHDAGHEVTGFGRRQAQDLPADFPDIAYHPVDLATAQGCQLLAARAPARLDMALLNAGIGHYRPLCRETPQAISDVLAVNLLMPMLTAQLLFELLQARRGVLGLVGSVAYRGAAGMPVYAASKAGLDGFGRSLRSEWQGRVDVRVIHPGPTATGMAGRAGLTSPLALRMMLPVAAVAAGIIDAMQGQGRMRRRVSFGAVIRQKITGRAA